MMMKFPSVYKEGANSLYCNLRTFMWWMIRGVVQPIALFSIIYFSYGPQHINPVDFSAPDVEVLGISVFVAYLWVQSLTLCMMMDSLSKYHFSLIWGMFVVTLASLYITSIMLVFDHFTGYYTVPEALKDSQLWFIHLIIVVVTLGPLVWLNVIHLDSHPTLAERLRVQMISSAEALPKAQQDGDYFYYKEQ